MGKTTKRIIGFVLLILSTASILEVSAAREEMLINDQWEFRLEQNVRQKKGDSIAIPHTWNSQDALSGTGKIDYHRGIGHYDRELFVPENWKGRRLFLNFEGVNSIAYIYVNEKFIGEHRGGYASFIFEITDNVRYGENNALTVRVSNAEQFDVMPLLGDFNFYGGIYRDVYLVTTDDVCISPLDYASCGVYLIQQSVSANMAKVNAKVLLSKKSDKARKAEVSITIRDGAKTILTKTAPVAIAAQSSQASVTIPFEISKPRLWNAELDPFMYCAEIELTVDGKPADKISQPLGLRYFSVDANQGFILNGKPYRLRGVCRHQDRSEIGNALLSVHHDEDLATIKEMGANAMRLAHYPNAQYTYNKLDSMGFVVWSEIPFVGPGGYADRGFTNSEAFKQNGRMMIMEMIRQQFNHPSICFWGIFNELKEVGDSPFDYLTELNAIAHYEDPSRITTSATNLDDVSINQITDLIGWNRYDGWYENDPSYLGQWLDATHAKHPTLKISVSEYGAGASIYHQQQELTKTVPVSKWHPENWQTHFHIENWKAISKRPFVWGSFIWNMFDFGAAHRTEGDRNGINDKGIVTFDRKHRKDSYYFYKANWNKNETTLYICEKRLVDRRNEITSVMVFTTLPNAELFINGVSCGERTSDDYATIKWDAVKLSKGENIVVVKAKEGKSEYSDSVVWRLW